MSITLSRYDSPLGPLSISTDGGALVGLDYTAQPRAGLPPPPAEVAGALDAYFAGDLAALDRLAVKLQGTQFQQEVWKALRRIPAGQTWTYAELARAVGSPKASRAVGSANGRNPVAIVVPCHRVIATGGKLGGYGGGLHRKAWLLKHERALMA